MLLRDTTASAAPAVRRLAIDLLTRDLRVAVDHVAPCQEILGRYAQANARLREAFEDEMERAFQTVRPVLLDATAARDSAAACFSYTVRYDLPLGRPLRWKNALLTEVPVRLALVHAMKDFKRFRRAEPDE